VALDADPLRDVRNYERVGWVMKGGVIAPRAKAETQPGGRP
jgi:hypothetical protein